MDDREVSLQPGAPGFGERLKVEQATVQVCRSYDLWMYCCVSRLSRFVHWVPSCRVIVRTLAAIRHNSTTEHFVRIT